MHKTKLTLFVFFSILLSKEIRAEEITGELLPYIGSTHTYHYEAEFLLLRPSWVITGATKVSQGNTGTDYWVTVQFNVAGNASLVFKNGAVTLGSLEVTVITPPSVPSAPTISSYNCGSTTVARGTPPSGSTWYWQTSSTGTATTNSASTYIVTTQGTTVYLRAKLNGYNIWSGASSITVSTVYLAPVGGTISGHSPGGYSNVASGTLTLNGYTGTIDKWQKRSPGGPWTDIPGSQGLTSLQFNNLLQTTEYIAVISSANCSSVNSSLATVTVFEEAGELPILGEQVPYIQGTYRYTCQTPSLLLQPSWIVLGGGTVVNQGNNGTEYWVDIQFHTLGGASIIFKNGAATTLGGPLEVPIVTPPVIPSSPTINTYNCGSTTVERGTPPSGSTWYWQTSSTGTSTTNSASTYAVTAPGTTVYLKAKLNAYDKWSDASFVTVNTVYPAPVGGTISGQSAGGYSNVASGTLTLNGYAGTIDKWQRRFPGGTWTDVPGSQGQNSIQFNNLLQTTEYKALVSRTNCSAVNSSTATISVFEQEGEIPINGEPFPDTQGIFRYTCQSPSLLLQPNWIVLGGGTVVNHGNNGTEYWADLQFNTLGEGYIILKSAPANTVGGPLEVTIISPPSIPDVPIISSYDCGFTTVARSTPPSGQTWYWQTSPDGTQTQTVNSSLTYPVTTPGTTVYLRSKLDIAERWSQPSSIVVNTVYAVPVPGSIAATASYFVNSGSGTLMLNGYQGTIATWQKRPVDGVWQDIPGSAGNATLGFSVDENTEFQALVGNVPCAPVASPAYTVSVSHLNFEGKISGTTKVVGTTNTGTLQLSGYSGVIDEWQYSADGRYWLSIEASASSTLQITDLTQSRYYRVKVTKKNTTSYTTAHLVSQYPAITDNIASENYVKEEVIRIPEANIANLTLLTPSQKTVAYSYVDGLGRTVQTVAKNMSPSQKDIVGIAMYDALGRQPRSYLPYTTTGSDFYSDVLTAQAAFYNGTDKVAIDSHPYAEVVFDGSPLNRIVEQGAPGSAWQPGTGHTVRTTSRSNTANEIRIWKADATSPGYYAPGTVIVQELTDENGNKVITFTDKEGKLLQKHIQETTTNWIKTLNIYDAIGRLVYVLQPEGVNQLETGTTITTSLLENYAFKYTYDARGRLAEKKAPNVGPVYIVYDPLERPVLTQNAKLRGENKWLFIKYDSKGRPVMQGLYKNQTETTQASMQTFLDGLYTVSNVEYPINAYYENRGTALHGYTNQSFPKTNADNTSIEVLSVSYYDNYDFDFNGSDDYSYTSQSLPGEGVQAAVDGLPTGSKRLILGSSTWLYAYAFYDKYGRTIQVRGNNHMSTAIDNLVTDVYDFEGKLLMRKAYHNAGEGRQTTVVNKYTYDHAGRVTHVYQNNNNAAADQLIAQYEYNELGQVVDKKLHNTTGTDFLQSIDYRYNIRGWLESINNAQLMTDNRNDDVNDLFGMELLYHTIESGLGNTAFFNGNISATKWKAPGAATGLKDQRSYKYTYDKSDRLLTSTFQARGASAWDKEAGTQNENMTYDQNGNILSLLRTRNLRGLSGTTVTSTAQTIDNLIYTYGGTNQLISVEDAVAGTEGEAGFNDRASNATEFVYNTTGSLVADDNKDISDIVYNILDKPEQIHFSDGRRIEYTYDAAGMKLTVKKFAAGVSAPQSVSDYVGNFLYENGALSLFGSPEGRVINTNGALEYQYAISDHQGNTRLVFTSAAPEIENPATGFEEEINNEFENYPSGGNRSSLNVFNHTDAPGATHSQLLNGGYNSQVGVTRSFKVYPGDKVKVEAFAKYWNPNSGTSNLSGFATALTSAFGLSSTATGEMLKAYNAIDNYGILSAAGLARESNPGDPKGFVTILLFDKDFNFLNAAWDQIDASYIQTGITENHPFDHLEREVTIQEEGYAYVYLSNESPTFVDIFFDDATITHTPTNVIQYNEYYPFGLQTAKSWTRTGSDNRFLYNSGSELNSASEWYETFYRDYDPALGRFQQVDPLAGKYHRWSPYNYAMNDPVVLNDPNGDEAGEEYVFWVYHTSQSIGYWHDGKPTILHKLRALGAHTSIGELQGLGGSSYRGSRGASAAIQEYKYKQQLIQDARNGDAWALQTYVERYGHSVSPGTGGTILETLQAGGKVDLSKLYGEGKTVGSTYWVDDKGNPHLTLYFERALGPQQGRPGDELIKTYERNDIMGWGYIFAGEILLEVGLGGNFVSLARKVVSESGIVNMNDKSKRFEEIVNSTVKFLNSLKKSFPVIRAAEPYISAAGVLFILRGGELHYENQSFIAPKILEANPDYYHHNISPIYPQKFGGGGATGEW